MYPSVSKACWVFSCFRNPPNSDMDYISLTCVRDHSYEYVCVYTRGLGTPTASQYNIFDSGKKVNSLCFLVLLTGLELGSLMSYNVESDALA